MSQHNTRKLARKIKKQKQKRLQLLMLVGGGILVLAGIVFAVFRNPQPEVPVEVAGSPSLKVDQDVIDLGNVKLGKVVEVTFQLSNVGDQPLRFSETPYIEVTEGC